MYGFSRCQRFLALKFIILKKLFIDFRSFVFDVFPMDFDVFFGVFFDVPFTLLAEKAKLENMRFDMQITMFREGRGILRIIDNTWLVHQNSFQKNVNKSLQDWHKIT